MTHELRVPEADDVIVTAPRRKRGATGSSSAGQWTPWLDLDEHINVAELLASCPFGESQSSLKRCNEAKQEGRSLALCELSADSAAHGGN